MPLSTIIRPPRRRAGIAALASAFCISLIAWPSAASAADTVTATTPSGIDILQTDASTATCTDPQVVPAFAPFGDARDYVLVPGGTFEAKLDGKTLDGWQLDRAKQDGDHPAFDGTTDDDTANKHALKIPPGGSAVSPAMCVDLTYPTMRLMAKATQGTGELVMQVAYPDSADPVFRDAATLDASGKAWGVSDDLAVYPERGGTTAGMRRVALRFVSVAGPNGAPGEWKIDELYVDPKRL
jgi:hypothetical protein